MVAVKTALLESQMEIPSGPHTTEEPIKNLEEAEEKVEVVSTNPAELVKQR